MALHQRTPNCACPTCMQHLQVIIYYVLENINSKPTANQTQSPTDAPDITTHRKGKNSYDRKDTKLFYISLQLPPTVQLKGYYKIIW